DRRLASVLGRQRAAQNGGSHKQRRGSQTACRRHCASAPLNFSRSGSEGSGNLKIIAFDLLGQASDVLLVRTGDYANRADADVTETTLLTLDPDRIPGD
ncbi:MAG TPA: hypothetical protein VGU71_08910, partial [Candidatus Dormibacteraeota bacterium]|nr:hypothetical protein [Candidatus Dormibacteraeota bacterium]